MSFPQTGKVSWRIGNAQEIDQTAAAVRDAGSKWEPDLKSDSSQFQFITGQWGVAKSCSVVLVELRGGFVTSLYSPQCFCPWPALPVTRVQLSRADGMSWPRVLPLSLTLGIFQGQDACVCVRRAVVYPQVCVHEMELITSAAYCRVLFALTGAGGGCSSPRI